MEGENIESLMNDLEKYTLNVDRFLVHDNLSEIDMKSFGSENVMIIINGTTEYYRKRNVRYEYSSQSEEFKINSKDLLTSLGVLSDYSKRDILMPTAPEIIKYEPRLLCAGRIGLRFPVLIYFQEHERLVLMGALGSREKSYEAFDYFYS